MAFGGRRPGYVRERKGEVVFGCAPSLACTRARGVSSGSRGASVLGPEAPIFLGSAWFLIGFAWQRSAHQNPAGLESGLTTKQNGFERTVLSWFAKNMF